MGDRPLRFCNDCRRKFTVQRQGEKKPGPIKSLAGFFFQ
jgi:hypothetical protein